MFKTQTCISELSFIFYQYTYRFKDRLERTRSDRDTAYVRERLNSADLTEFSRHLTSSEYGNLFTKYILTKASDFYAVYVEMIN